MLMAFAARWVERLPLSPAFAYLVVALRGGRAAPGCSHFDLRETRARAAATMCAVERGERVQRYLSRASTQLWMCARSGHRRAVDKARYADQSQSTRPRNDEAAQAAALAGAQVTSTATTARDAGGKKGIVTLTGAIDNFMVGGQEFWIDNVCAME